MLWNLLGWPAYHLVANKTRPAKQFKRLCLPQVSCSRWLLGGFLCTEGIEMGKAVIGQLEGESFEQLDTRITEVIRDFVQLGELLIRMRDGQAYRQGGYVTFEEYCKAKAGLSISEVRRTIQYSLAFGCFQGRDNAPLKLPETKAQMEALIPAVNFKMEKRSVQKEDGTEVFVKQTVGVKNPKRIVDQWEKTVNEFDRLTAKAQRENTRPPTLSAKFVRNQLPNELKVSPERGFDCNPLVNLRVRLEKLTISIDQQGFTDKRKVPVLMKAEPPCLPPMVKDLHDVVCELTQELNTLADILEGHLNGN